AIVRSRRRGDLPHAMRGARHASSVAGIPEGVTEALLGQRLAVRTDNEGEVTTGTSIEGFLQDRQHRHDGRYSSPGLLGPEPANPVSDVLATGPHGTPMPEAAVE